MSKGNVCFKTGILSAPDLISSKAQRLCDRRPESGVESHKTERIREGAVRGTVLKCDRREEVSDDAAAFLPVLAPSPRSCHRRRDQAERDYSWCPRSPSPGSDVKRSSADVEILTHKLVST